MGGIGSGNWYRYGSAATDDVKNIDIRLLRKWGYLPDRQFWGSRYGRLTWTRGSEETGSVGYVVHSDRFILSFHWQSDPVEINQTVWFDRMACNFGGERLWFSCPRCHTGVAL